MAAIQHDLTVKVRMLDVEQVEAFTQILAGIAEKHPHLVPELSELAAMAINPKTLDERRIAWWSRLRLWFVWRRARGL